MSSTNTPLRIGVIGTGLMGDVHARSLRARVPGATLVAVSDFDEERASALAAELGVVAYRTGGELIGAADVDAVVIASPDVTHADYAIACIQAGKHVLCEKPLAESQARAEEVLDAELEAGRRLVQVGFMREFDPQHLAVKEAVSSGRIGTPVMFRGIHINPYPVGATDVGRALSQSLIHDINSARFLMGQEIVDVFSRWVRREDSGPDECRLAAVVCTFANGAIGLMDVNVESGYGYIVSAEVVGTTGTAATIDPSHAAIRSSGAAAEDVAATWAVRFAPAYLAELEAWIASIRSGDPVGPSAYDGYVANVVADACIASAQTGQSVQVSSRPRTSIYL